ncbi:phenylalanine--tRNA ligase subunit beta [Wolbachia endosymbiont of Pentidionis agamae]|uniref:phenylalanine--tRNA ligase subunit beta n=1 Tax=Wolbachia endosymbiont of Pentidionis agamae TaxID=3110435 RepID=UPI002FD27540
MKITLSWLLEYLDTNASLTEITDKLTHIGLEVESVIDNANLTGFIVVKILEIAPHPNADKLKLCKVDCGDKILQVVCGASNVKNNMKTVLASIDSILPGSDITIKSIKIRGILSEGMLCSASELELNYKDNEGIIELSDDYQVGDKFFNNDTIIDINITPNRGDCLSVYGVARDLSATGIGKLKPINHPKIFSSIDSIIDVEVSDDESFFTGRYITGVQNKESPRLLKERLQSVGINSISLIVDIVNCIMMSFGQPMHAYNADNIEKRLTVRKATDGENFTGLNGKQYSLNQDITVISDDKNIHSIAGVLGSKRSECTLETTNIFLESAWFDPISIIKSSRQLNISTDSSYRFTRSVDPSYTINSLNLATQMILDLCGGKASSLVSSGDFNKKNHYIDFNYHDVNKFGSISASSDEIFSILTKLGFDIDKKMDDKWNVKVPSWRPNITIAADLIEEVTRIYGYDKIKEEPLLSNSIKASSIYDNLRTVMSRRGLDEVFTWSFMSEPIAEKFGYFNKQFIIENPINNNYDIMRPSIIPNLLQVISDNSSYGVQDAAIFEIGPIYNSEDVLSEPIYTLSGVRVGQNLPRNHYNINRDVDIFDVKADIISVLESLNINYNDLKVERTSKEYYHPGKSGAFSFKNKIFCYFGKLHPNIVDFYNLKQKVVGFELMLQDIHKLPVNKKQFIDYKYQSVKRDFAFIINKDIQVGHLIDLVRKSSKLITEVLVFDVYQGPNIEINKISVAFSVTFCSPTHTLSEEEIQKQSYMIINLVRENTGGVLRS